MKAVKTKLVVLPDGTVEAQMGEKLAPGEHEGIFLENVPPARDRRHPIRLPLHHSGPWPEGFRVSRDQIYGED